VKIRALGRRVTGTAIQLAQRLTEKLDSVVVDCVNYSITRFFFKVLFDNSRLKT
jgi:hypothetical protein